MSKNRAGRFAYALIVLVLLGIIGRNGYHHYLNSRLLAAVEEADVSAVRSLLSRGADPNSRKPPKNKWDKGMLALELAMNRTEIRSRQQSEIVCLLLQHGAGISQERGNDWLQIACLDGKVAIARCLLEHGTDPNSPGVYTRTPIDVALDFAKDIPSNTPPAQLEAVRQQKLPVSRELVRLLREHGAHVTLWQAARIDDAEALRALLDSGTPIDQPEPASFTSAFKGPTALMRASEAGSMKAVRLLLTRGANVNAISYSSSTPLEKAIAGHHLEIARLLLRQGANVNFPRATRRLSWPAECCPRSYPISCAR